MEDDTYKTISKPSKEVLYKDKNSKFFGYAFPVANEVEVKYHLETLKKKHPSAGHFCYAYQFGKQENDISFRANDDGEPSNSAGMPIYGQIQSFGVTNLIIVVVRYFGGVKLGVSGLISAYKTTAQLTLNTAKIITKTINTSFKITFEYKNINKVMRLIKEKNLKVIDQTLELDCQMIISVRLKDAENLFGRFKNFPDINIKIYND